MKPIPRRVAEIDPNSVKSRAIEGASDRELADYHAISEASLRKHFKSELSRGRATRRMLLRKEQTKQALEGSATLLVFLGKAELGQGETAKEIDEVRVMRRSVDRSAKPKG
jgi:hypothetical protein